MDVFNWICRYLFWVSHDQSKYDETTFEYTIAVLGNNSSGSHDSQSEQSPELSDGGPPQDEVEGVNKAQALF